MTDFSYPILGDEINLPFYVIGIGAIDKEHHISREHGYPYHQIICCVRGSGTLRFGGREYSVKEGQGFYLPPEFPHEYSPNEDIWETHWITFGGSEIPKILKLIKFDEAKVFTVSDMNVIDAIFKKMLYLLKTNYFYSGHQCTALLYTYLIELNRLVNLQNAAHDSTKLSQLQPVIDYIDEKYSEDLTLVELSALINLSPQYLCRLFKDCMNLRPFEYLSRRRIQQAKILLIEESCTINEIAAKVGYNDCSYFCAVFKKHEMLSPAEFRTLHKKSIRKHS
ncbi:MAG: AraC family transcriptional regulator [Oscillospiraceae bacterium]